MTTLLNSRAANRVLNRIIAYSAVLLFVVGAFCLGTVWLRHQTANAANRIRGIEEGIAIQQRQISALGVELARAMSQEKLLERNRILALGLIEPPYQQIVRVSEDVEARLNRKVTNGSLTASYRRGD